MVSKAELGELCRMTDAEFTAWQAQVNRSSCNKLVGESGIRGVCRFRNKWKAETRHGGRFVFIGTFESKHEAARAYDRFVLAHRGRKALLTFHPRNYVTPEGDLLPAVKKKAKTTCSYGKAAGAAWAGQGPPPPPPPPPSTLQLLASVFRLMGETGFGQAEDVAKGLHDEGVNIPRACEELRDIIVRGIIDSKCKKYFASVHQHLHTLHSSVSKRAPAKRRAIAPSDAHASRIRRVKS